MQRRSKEIAQLVEDDLAKVEDFFEEQMRSDIPRYREALSALPDFILARDH